MKYNKKMFLEMFILLFIMIYLFLTPGSAESEQFGVVLIAHGSNQPEWNTKIEDFYNSFNRDLPPSQLAFLRFVEGRSLEVAVNNLRNDHPDMKEFLFVHLAPSSYSIRHDEIELTVADLIKPPLQYKVAPAMDDHLLAGSILKNYAEEFYRNSPTRSPENESLILLGYGPTDDLENVAWVRQLERIGARIRADLRFKEVACITLRHHAADLIRSQAIADLQRTARRLKVQGRVVVVPYILCAVPEDGFQRELQSCLRGIVDPQDICKKGVISHDNTKAWVTEVISKKMNQTVLRSVNRNWSAMDGEMATPLGSNKYDRIKIEKLLRKK